MSGNEPEAGNFGPVEDDDETRHCRKCGGDLYDIEWLFDPCPADEDGEHREAGSLRRFAARSWRAVRILFRAARILAVSRDLPVLLRVLFVIGLFQIPVLPVDEIALAIALTWLALFHRGTLRGALAKARTEVAGTAVQA